MRRLALVLAVLAVLGLPTPAAAGGERAAPDPATTTTLVEGDDLPGIIPRPNSGTPPTRPGERGGWAQLLLAGILFVAVAVVFAVIARSAARTTRAKRLRDQP